MAYVTVPKDLSKIKTKVFFGLTKRQLICFTPAVLLGVPLFFLLKESAGNSTATLCMMMVMLPFFLLAMLNIGRTSAYNLVKEGHFKTVRVGNAIRISKKSFDEWLDAQAF